MGEILTTQKSGAGNPALLAGEYIEDPKTGEKKLAAAVALGSIKTEKKAAASARNGFKPGNKVSKNGGRPWKALSEVACNCSGGESADASAHTWRCPKGQSIRRRIAEGRDVLTGTLLADSGAS